MNYLAAAMLIALAGKTPDEESIKKVLREAGAKIDDAKIKKFVAEIKGKDVLNNVSEKNSTNMKYLL